MIRAPSSLGVVRQVAALLRQDLPCTCKALALHVRIYARPYWKFKRRMEMTKKPFTTRLDPAILELAQKLAEIDRRSITAVIEIALIEYAERRGIKSTKGE
ncbi:hypothetical protein [Mesorhizobium sp. NPDC059025]|uniref:hypothetical protein n=1 Tax=unclassified Mesorhizobium TaxID=325217 RepID=UPI0036C18E97